MRHLHWLFEALGRPYDKPTRTQVDSALRGLLGLDEAQTCYEVWAAIKALPAEEQELLPERVSELLEPVACETVAPEPKVAGITAG